MVAAAKGTNTHSTRRVSMKQILFISTKNQCLYQEKISCELHHEGYSVESIPLDLFINRKPALSRYDLAIIHLHPDVTASWRVYLDLRHELRDFPLLAFMSHHSMESLKAAIQNIAETIQRNSKKCNTPFDMTFAENR